MNECGVVNIYMIMMSYLFAPYDKSDDDLDFGESAVRQSSNNSEKELVEMDAPN